MKATKIAFCAGLAGGFIAARCITRQPKAGIKTQSKSSIDEILRLRADLIHWLVTAPSRGYSATQIACYYNDQVAFIEMISDCT